MKIEPKVPRPAETNSNPIGQNLSTSADKTGGDGYLDMEYGGGGDDNPNGPPKAGASVSAD